MTDKQSDDGLPALPDDRIVDLVDKHVGGPTPSYPLDMSDWLNFARAVIYADRTAVAAALAAQKAAPAGVSVPLAFLQGFLALAHNYSLRAEPPDYYRGVEGDAFSNAYRRCGEDLAKLRAMLAATPTEPSTPTEREAEQAEAPKPEPFAWLVCSVNSDGSLSLEYAAPWREAAHEHINDAITEHGIEEASSWVVRPAYLNPQPDYDELEREHMGDFEKKTGIYATQPTASNAGERDKGTPGLWFVRKLMRDGEMRDCFVSAPDCQGLAYGAEILGDDEYRDGLERKLADCELIVSAVNAARATQPTASKAEPVAPVVQTDDVDRLLREVFALCEATEDAQEVEPKNEHQRGFDRGRRFEAKSIRRAIGTWFQDAFCGRSFMGEPMIAAQPPQQPEASGAGEQEDDPTAEELEAFRRKHWAHWNAAENLLIAHLVQQLRYAALASKPPAGEQKPVGSTYRNADSGVYGAEYQGQPEQVAQDKKGGV